MYHTSRTCCSTVRPSVAFLPPKYARNRISILVVSVLPAPLSPLTRMELLFPSWTMALESSKDVVSTHASKKKRVLLTITCKRYLQLQIHGDSILQMVLPCIVASYEHHTNEVASGMG